MPEQYVATDKTTGVEVTVTGEFPPHPDDRMRIARTTTLFTRLMATLLSKPESERRAGFRAVETQLELADALIREDMDDVRRLVRQTMESMGVTDEQLRELARQLRDLGGMDEQTADQIAQALGLPADDESSGPADSGPVAGWPPAAEADEPSSGPGETGDDPPAGAPR